MTVSDKYKEKLSKYNHLVDIRQKLWNGDGKSRVSIMVGAGFSRNAMKLDESIQSMALWKDLKEKLIEKLGNSEKYLKLDVLELGNIYEKEFGIINLEKLLKESIPDANYEPGEIHKKLLELPFADVYTTNYDTLLERAAETVYERNYQTIYDIHDIPGSISPRIVKLHGSFPSHRPFVFSKKDYDNYPTESAPFVNMVQQSIMETTLVLIGFSGDDPNFKKWIEWVTKNLGNHKQKIYLLGINEDEENVFFEDNLITNINFKDVYMDNSDSYSIFFNDLFDFLKENPNEDQRKWPYKKYDYINNSLENTTDIEEEFNKVIKILEHNRITYPGWLILPSRLLQRGYMHDIISDYQFFFKKLNIEKKISFSKEIVWLYQTFRIPLDYYIFQIFLEIIEDIQILEKDLSKCHELLLFLLNEARLDCNMLEFKKIKSLLEKLNLLGNDKNEYDYQCILNAIDENKVNEALLLLREWKIVNHSLDYQLKKEILLIKYDKNQRELKNLKKLLENVRKIEMVDRNNYFILSIEGVILSILKKYEKDDTHDYFNRLIQLESSFCNPQTTIEYYSAINFESNEEITGKTHNFDGNIVVHQKFGNFDKASVNATFFLLMMYETYNLGLNENNTIEVLRTIQKYYPTFVLKKFLELGKLKEIEKFYSKQKIISFSSDQKDNLFHYLFEGINDFEGHNLKIYTEVMYRLYFVLDLKYQLRLDQFAIDLYTNSKLYEYYKFDIKEIFSKIFSRILVNKNWRDLDKYINKLFNLPLVGEINTDLEYVNLDENFTFDPLDFFEYNKKLMPLINIVSDKYEVECLLKYIKDSNIKISIRMGAWRRLLVLNATGSLLNKDYVHLKKEIKIILEKEQDILFNLYLPSFAVLTFVNEKEFTLAYFNKYMKREIPESFTPGVLMMGTGVKQYLDELRNLLLNRDYSYYEYQIVFEKIISWWDSQYELASKELKIKEYEYNNQDLKHIVVFLKNEILSKIKIENFSEENKFFFINCYEQLKKIDSELYLLLIPGIIKLKNNEEELLEILINGMTDSRSKFAKFAIVAMQDIANLKQKKEISINVRPSKEKLLQLLLVQKESTLKEITGVLCFVLKDHPSFFTKNELTEIKGSMNLFYQQFVVQKNQKVFSVYELIKIISNYVSMATALIENKLATVEEFKDWKNYCSETVFYEIKKYEYIFNKNEVTR